MDDCGVEEESAKEYEDEEEGLADEYKDSYHNGRGLAPGKTVRGISKWPTSPGRQLMKPLDSRFGSDIVQDRKNVCWRKRPWLPRH